MMMRVWSHTTTLTRRRPLPQVFVVSGGDEPFWTTQRTASALLSCIHPLVVAGFHTTRCSLMNSSNEYQHRGYYPKGPRGRPNNPNNNNNNNNNSGTNGNVGGRGGGHGGGGGPRQSFAQVNIEPEEWDEDYYTNPLYRPKYTHRARILSKDDFNNRPKVGTSVMFENMSDAMVNFSWMTHAQQKEICITYRDFLKVGYEKYGVTSHEYVCRVLAKRYELRADRIAAVIQLQHDQERMKLQGKEVREDCGKYMDNCFLTEIRQCYHAYGMKPPHDLSKVEDIDNLGPESGRPSINQRCVDDLIDVDEIWRQYKDEYLPEKAKRIIANHKYIEDVDDESIITPVDKEVSDLIDRHKELKKTHDRKLTKWTPQALKETDNNNKDENGNDKQPVYRKRKRFPFVAQFVNTQKLKAKIKKAKNKPLLGMKGARLRRAMSMSYTNNNIHNSLVEYDGTLRRATLADVRTVDWKPMRYNHNYTLEQSVSIQEVIYRKAKLDWLNYINGRDHSGVFGDDGKIASTSIVKLQELKEKQQEKQQQQQQDVSPTTMMDTGKGEEEGGGPSSNTEEAATNDNDKNKNPNKGPVE